jgi:hypothetical protein
MTVGRKHEGRKSSKDLSLYDRVTLLKTDLKLGEMVCTGLIGLIVWIIGVNFSYIKCGIFIDYMTNYYLLSRPT